MNKLDISRCYEAILVDIYDKIIEGHQLTAVKERGRIASIVSVHMERLANKLDGID